MSNKESQAEQVDYMPAFGRVVAALFPFDRRSFGPVTDKERNRRDG